MLVPTKEISKVIGSRSKAEKKNKMRKKLEYTSQKWSEHVLEKSLNVGLKLVITAKVEVGREKGSKYIFCEGISEEEAPLIYREL